MAYNFSFGSGTQSTHSTDIPSNNQGSSGGFTFGSKASNTYTTPSVSSIRRHQQSTSNTGNPGFSFGAQISNQKVNEPTKSGFSFGSAANQSDRIGSNQTSIRQPKIATRQDYLTSLEVGTQAHNLGIENKQEVFQLRREVKLLKKKLSEMANVEERVKQLEYLHYNKDFKVLLLGDSGVGKSALTYKHLTGAFERSHLATTEIDITTLQFYHNKSKILFELWEIPEDVQNKDVMCAGADCAIIMFDVTSHSSHVNAVNVHVPTVRKVCGGIPIVLLGNKTDLSDISAKDPNNLGNIKYYDISVKTHYNFDTPFLWLMRKLLRCDELDFVPPPLAPPPEFIFDEATKKKYEEELAAMMLLPLPEDNDEDL